MDWNTRGDLNQESGNQVCHLLTKVWIETPSNSKYFILYPWSPSYEGVDWNSHSVRSNVIIFLVTFLRRCGLKHTGWSLYGRLPVSPSYEGVDWNIYRAREPVRQPLSPSYEGVDWNILVIEWTKKSLKSPSYEGVDWNLRLRDQRANTRCHLLTKVWIETISSWVNSRSRLVTFLRRCGLKQYNSATYLTTGR